MELIEVDGIVITVKEIGYNSKNNCPSTCCYARDNMNFEI